MPPGLRAFNFNLAEASQKFQVDLIGSTRYAESDPDWACEEAFVSQPRFFDLPREEVGDRWEGVHQLICIFVAEYIRSNTTSPFRTAEAVTVGFVDGELQKVWPEHNPRPQR